MWRLSKGYKVYWNLHEKVFSVLAWNVPSKGWRLYTHASCLSASDVQFKVHEAGRQRVIKEQSKNVHAYVIAQDIKILKYSKLPDLVVENGYKDATYNPYIYKGFVDVKTKEILSRASSVVMFHRKIKYK